MGAARREAADRLVGLAGGAGEAPGGTFVDRHRSGQKAAAAGEADGTLPAGVDGGINVPQLGRVRACQGRQVHVHGQTLQGTLRQGALRGAEGDCAQRRRRQLLAGAQPPVLHARRAAVQVAGSEPRTVQTRSSPSNLIPTWRRRVREWRSDRRHRLSHVPR